MKENKTQHSVPHRRLSNIKGCEYLISLSSALLLLPVTFPRPPSLFVFVFFFSVSFFLFLIMRPFFPLFLFCPDTCQTVTDSQALAPRTAVRRQMRTLRESPSDRSSSTRDRPKPRGGSAYWRTGSTSRPRPSRFCCQSR